MTFLFHQSKQRVSKLLVVAAVILVMMSSTTQVKLPRKYGFVAAFSLTSIKFGTGRFISSKELGRKTFPPLGVSNASPFDNKIDRSPSTNQQDHPMPAMLQGKSPKIIRLRKAIQELAADESIRETNSPIVVLGPKGCGKASIVEELITLLPACDEVVTISLDDAVSFVDLLIGPEGGKATSNDGGVLDRLASRQNITVVFKGFQSVSADSEDNFQLRQHVEQTVLQLLSKGSYWNKQDGSGEIPFLPRIIYSVHGSKKPALVDDLADGTRKISVIQVPSLEARTQDMKNIVTAKIKSFEKEYGLRNIQVTQEANKRLLDHAWVGGEDELDDELRKALLRLALSIKRDWSHRLLGEDLSPASSSLPVYLRSKHMLTDSPSESIRTRLLYEFPLLRKVIESPWIFDHTLRYIVTPIFVVFLVVLFFGAQTREQSAALTVFWAGWWPAVMLSFPFLGRIWCSICPFMAVGNIAQEMVMESGIQLKKWPKWAQEIGPLFAFALFFAILAWEELWNLPQNGTLSAWLLLLITSGAVFNSVQYEKRLWCRYLCPIGAMCRTFGVISMTEVRSFKANCQGCTDPQCVNGHSSVPDKSDVFALKGCTMGLKNNQLQDMGHCTMCMSCVKNCDKEVPELNTRPLGIDFGLPWLLPPVFQNPGNMAVSQVETNYWMGALLTVLQGSVLVHYMPKVLEVLGMDTSIAHATPGFNPPFYAHAAVTVGLMATPGLLSLLLDELAIPLEDLLTRLRYVWGKPLEKDVRRRRVLIQAYETILKLDEPLEEAIHDLDPDGDGLVSCWEFQRLLKNLSLPVTDCQIITESIRQSLGKPTLEALPVETFLDVFQQLYVDAIGSRDGASHLPKKFQVKTKKSSVELFNELDQDGDGFIMPGEFDRLVDREFAINRPWKDKLALFQSADVLGKNRLNLFEFMTLYKKVVRAGIQEIGYGYLPLAWASLTAYWVGISLRELGSTLNRLPDTFYLDRIVSIDLPYWVAEERIITVVQSVLILGSLPFSIGLTQKLCDDNKITGLRFGVHVALQVLGAWATLYFMLATDGLA